MASNEEPLEHKAPKSLERSTDPQAMDKIARENDDA